MRVLVLALSCAMLSLPALAREIDPAERREVPYDAHIPVCDNMQGAGQDPNRFGITETRFWNSPLRILGFEGVRQLAWRPWGLDDPAPVLPASRSPPTGYGAGSTFRSAKT